MVTTRNSKRVTVRTVKDLGHALGLPAADTAETDLNDLLKREPCTHVIYDIY